MTTSATPHAPGRSTTARSYSEEDKPLGGYAVLTGTFTALFASAVIALQRRRRMPSQIKAGDLLLVGVATHKLSRLVTKDRVTSFARAPFTEYQGKGGPGEVDEKPRGRGLRRAIGELLVCPYCLGQWIAAAFIFGLAVAPRFTRLVAAILAVVTISDTLQIAYKGVEEKWGKQRQ